MSRVPPSPAEATQQPEPQPAEPDVIGLRISAALIDLVLLAGVFVGLGVTIGESGTEDGSVYVNLDGPAAVLYLVLVLAYYFAFETAIGQTVGKLILGLRVVRVDSSKPSAGSIVIRTLLRLVDGLPVLYLVGFITMMATGPRRQRLGDLAAGTRVARK